jgi:hypothetical protein
MTCLSPDQREQIIAFALLYQVGDTLTVPALGYVKIKKAPVFTGCSLHPFSICALQSTDFCSITAQELETSERKRGAQSRLEYTAVKAPPSFSDWKAELVRFAAKTARTYHSK